MNWRTITKKILKWTGFVAGGLILCLLALFGILQTEEGRTRLAGVAERAFTEEGWRRVEIGRIRGVFPFRFELDRLVIDNRFGLSLSLSDLQADWSPWSLLRGDLHVRTLRCGFLDLERLPGKGGERSPSSELPRWLAAFVRFKVDHLGVAELVLGEAVLGERAVFRLDANLNATVPSGQWVTRLQLDRTDGPEMQLLVNGTIHGSGRFLLLDASGRETSGGLFSRNVGIPGPVQFSLRGEGPLSGWYGRLEVHAGGAGAMGAEIRTSYSGPLEFDVKGMAEPEQGFLSDYLGSAPGEKVRFSLNGGLGKDRRFTIGRFSLEAEEAAFELWDSSISKDGGIEGRVEFRHQALNRLEKAFGFPLAGRVKVEGSVSGRLLRPSANLTFMLDDLRLEGMVFQKGSGELRAQVEEEEKGEGVELRLQTEGMVRGLSMGKTPLPEKDLQWGLSLVRSSSGLLQVRKMALKGERSAVQISGNLLPETGAGKFDVEAETRDLRSLTRSVGLDFQGSARVKAAIEGQFKEGTLQADLQGSAKPQGPEWLQPLLSPGVEWKSRVSLEQGKRVTFSETALTNALARVTGKGTLDLSTLKGAVTAQIDLHELKPLSTLAGTPLQGVLQVKGSAESSGERMNVHAEIHGEGVSVRALRLGGIRAELRASGNPSSPDGSFEFSVGELAGGISGRSRFSLAGKRISFPDLFLEGTGRSRVNGNLSLDLDSLLAEGGLEGECSDLRGFSAILGRPLEGKATLKGELKKVRETQQLGLVLSGRNLKVDSLEAGAVTLRATLNELMSAPRGRAEMEGEALKIPGMRLSSFQAGISGSLQEIAFSAGAGGELDRKFDLETGGLLRFAEKGTLRVNKLKGRYGRLPFLLSSPAVIEGLSTGDLEAGEVKISLGTGTLIGSGRVVSGRCDLSFKLSNLPLPLIIPATAPSIEGLGSGEVALKGRVESPEATARFRLGGLRIRDPQLKSVPPADLDVRADLRGDRLRSEFQLLGITAEPFSGSVDVPLRFSLSPLSAASPTEKELKGALNGKVDLRRIGRFLGMHDQEMGGVAEVALRLDGSTGQPRVSGAITLENGSYENAWSGTLLKNVNIVLRGGSDRLVIERATASDGEEGKAAVAGWLEIDPRRAFPFQLDLDFQKSKIVRHDWLTAKGKGRVQLKGSFSHALLTGEVQVESGEFRIPDRIPPEMPNLDVIEIHGREPVENGVEKKGEVQSSMEFDLRVKTLGHLFVRGRGLESEWMGELRIQGPVDDPGLTGELRVERGRFDFLDRRFTLNQGRIVFNGIGPSSPFLDVMAQSTTKEITANLQLIGPVKAPEIKLSSDPPFPQDEVLSRLLFGQGVSRISPVQAVQLARALNKLSGRNTMDFLGVTQRWLKIDQLEVRQSGENNEKTSISAGKYLRDNVYLEVEQNIGPKGTKASVDWEITPHISVETELGANAESGVGLNWRWDY